MALTDRLFGPIFGDPDPDRILALEANATSAHDLARIWHDYGDETAEANELAHMDEALDALIELGVGR